MHLNKTAWWKFSRNCSYNENLLQDCFFYCTIQSKKTEGPFALFSTNRKTTEAAFKVTITGVFSPTAGSRAVLLLQNKAEMHTKEDTKKQKEWPIFRIGQNSFTCTRNIKWKRPAESGSSQNQILNKLPWERWTLTPTKRTCSPRSNLTEHKNTSSGIQNP